VGGVGAVKEKGNKQESYLSFRRSDVALFLLVLPVRGLGAVRHVSLFLWLSPNGIASHTAVRVVVACVSYQTRPVRAEVL